MGWLTDAASVPPVVKVCNGGELISPIRSLDAAQADML
jgi:hypothetical protein